MNSLTENLLYLVCSNAIESNKALEIYGDLYWLDSNDMRCLNKEGASFIVPNSITDRTTNKAKSFASKISQIIEETTRPTQVYIVPIPAKSNAMVTIYHRID